MVMASRTKVLNMMSKKMVEHKYRMVLVSMMDQNMIRVELIDDYMMMVYDDGLNDLDNQVRNHNKQENWPAYRMHRL